MTLSGHPDSGRSFVGQDSAPRGAHHASRPFIRLRPPLPRGSPPAPDEAADACRPSRSCHRDTRCRRGSHRARHARRHRTECCRGSCRAVDITNERTYRATTGTASPSRCEAAVAILNGGTSGMRGNIALLSPRRGSCSRSNRGCQSFLFGLSKFFCFFHSFQVVTSHFFLFLDRILDFLTT